MDSIQDKKWFVYMVDHHEGPFSLEELKTQMTAPQPKVTSASYVWCDGMSDWKPMTEISAFSGIIQIAPAIAPTPLIVDQKNNQQATQILTREPALEIAPHLEAADAEPAVSLPVLEEPSFRPAQDPDSASQNEPVAAVPLESSTSSTPPTPVEKTQTGGIQPKAYQNAKSLPLEPVAPPSAKKKNSDTKPPSRFRSSIRVFILLGVILLVGIGTLLSPALDSVVNSQPILQALRSTLQENTQPYLFQWVERYPSLASYISPIEPLSDVSRADYEELKSAVLPTFDGTPDSPAPQVAVAVSQSDLLAPSFYVTSNLPDQTLFHIYLEGVSETLLNHLQFQSRLEARLLKKIGRSSPVRFPDGKSIPKGEYRVYVVEAPQQEPAIQTLVDQIPPLHAKLPAQLPRGVKVLHSTTFFLGGAKDETYLSRLKEFHDKLKTKADSELSEIKQLYATLESQLQSTVSQMTALRATFKKGKVPPASRKKWSVFKNQWQSLQTQIQATTQKWTPEMIQNELFYGSLYQSLRDAEAELSKLQTLHDQWFEANKDFSSLDVETSSATATAQSALGQLKTKINHVEQLTPYPSGMPRREGI